MKRTLKIAGIAVFALLTLTMSGMAWFMLSTPSVNRLALASGLIDATSVTGQTMLSQASAKTDYEQLVPEFVPQSRRAFCGVASSVTVINALLHPEPRMSQDALFTPKTAAIKGELAVSFSGLTLEQLAQVFAAHGLQVQITHAAQSSLEAFRETARAKLAEPLAYLVVNYDRKGLAQEGTGHISPVAAYNSEQDTVLVLDVAAHKYPYTWVPVIKLWNAMNTTDPASGETRGYLLVSSSTAQHAGAAGGIDQLGHR